MSAAVGARRVGTGVILVVAWAEYWAGHAAATTERIENPIDSVHRVLSVLTVGPDRWGEEVIPLTI